MTIIGGAIGAALGSLPGGFSIMVGWQVGAAIGGLLDFVLAPKMNYEGGKLSDRRITFSSYGTPIPKAWGLVRLNTNVIWAAKDDQGNHLIEHSRQVSGGGGGSRLGGGGSYTEYWYTATIACALAEGAFIDADGTTRHNAGTIKRIWFDDKLVYDVDDLFDTNPYDIDFDYYDGSLTQDEDPDIEAEEGVGQTIAYRGLRYIKFKDLDLFDYGNRIPAIAVMLDIAGNTADQIIEDCLATVLPVSQIDVTDVVGISVDGYVIDRKLSVQDTLSQISTFCDIDIVEVDGTVKAVLKGQAVVATITEDDLGASVFTLENGDRTSLTKTIDVDHELPNKITVNYPNSNRDLEAGTQEEIRNFNESDNEITVSFGISMTSLQAKKLAAKMMDILWTEQEKYSFTLAPKFVKLIPSDCVNIPENGGTTRVRITAIEIGTAGELIISAVKDNPDNLVQDQVTVDAEDDPAGFVGDIVNTEFRAWSGKEIKDIHKKSPGFYVAATGDKNWGGCVVYCSVDNGTTWLQMGICKEKASIGLVDQNFAINGTDLFAELYGGADFSWFLSGLPWINDPINLTGTKLGANWFAVWDDDVDGYNNVNLEYIGFDSYSISVPTYVYEFSDLTRAKRGTAQSAHAAGSFIAFLSPAVQRIELPDDYVGSDVLVRCVSKFQTISSQAVIDRELKVRIKQKTPETINLNGGTIVDGTSQSVLFLSDDAEPELTEDPGYFVYDATDKQLGIGTGSPEGGIHVKITANTHPVAVFQQADAYAQNYILCKNVTGTVKAKIDSAGKGWFIGIDAGSTIIANVATPVAGTDAANKDYVDSLIGGAGAPEDATYVVLSVNATLTAERVLTGTANRITITDNGAGSTVVLSTPQDIHTGASPTFAGLNISSTGTINFASSDVVITHSTNTLAFDGASTYNFTNSASGITIHIKGIGNNAIELGRVDGTSSTPYIDFHSGATAVDYDCRLIASGGTGSVGQGLLGFVGAGGFCPNSSDGAPLGSTSKMWSDLFLASGGVINFNNGNAVLTHSTGEVTVTAGNWTVPGTSGQSFKWDTGATGPTSTSAGTVSNRYGGASTFLGNPSGWVLINVAGTDYAVPYYVNSA